MDARNETVRERVGTVIQKARNGTLTADEAAGEVLEEVRAFLKNPTREAE